MKAFSVYLNSVWVITTRVVHPPPVFCKSLCTASPNDCLCKYEEVNTTCAIIWPSALMGFCFFFFCFVGISWLHRQIISLRGTRGWVFVELENSLCSGISSWRRQFLTCSFISETSELERWPKFCTVLNSHALRSSNIFYTFICYKCFVCFFKLLITTKYIEIYENGP